MKKRLLSILLMCCMVLTLLPTTAFAEESTETPPVCTCETACAVETMNAECSVCGAEGASAENCAKYIKPADDAAVQPEGEVSDPQPETALTALIGGSETVTEVNTADDLIAAIADVNFDTVKLTTDISISTSLTVKRTVTLDLNGHVLKYESANKGSPLAVEDSACLTIKDSGSNALHKFKPNSDGLWVLDETNGTETVYGGVITGGTGYLIQFGSGARVYDVYYGGAVYIKPGGTLNMEGGSIVGCSAVYGGGVYVGGEFVMTGGSIIGCAADRGGGVYMRDNDAVFNMSGSAAIRCCKAASKDTSHASGGGVYALGAFTMSDNAAICDCECITGSGRAAGGGVYVSYHNKNTEFTMSGNAVIDRCKVTSPQNGKSYGGVYVSSRSSLTLKDQAAIRKCSAENTVSGATYGGGIFAEGTLTIAGRAKVGEDCSAAVGSGIYMEVGSDFIVPQNLYANGGVIAGEVVLNNSSKYGATLKITGSDEGVTEFKGSVLNNNGIIEKGEFTGEVTNNGTISGGVFTGTVSNNGTITGGTFSGGITGTPALATGSGTETDPYQIGTAEGLKWFRDKVNDAKTKEETKICAVLTADIDLKNEEWTPIGIDYTIYSGKPPYAGTFDGKGHTIKNLSIDNSSAQYVGLFGYVCGGTIRNLTVSGSVKGSNFTGGIAGGADSGTFENCANLCEVQGGTTENDTTGGIIGFAPRGEDLIVRDCYNVGSITDRHAGGIIGLCNNMLETISNCYNVGTVTGTANAGAIIGIYSANKISNCYYLEGSVIRNDNGDTASIPKTATEFADGTVLALLKTGERDNNADPWADECKYLAAADKTLPVFNGQGDAHDHQSNDWKSNETEHWQVCTCGAVFHKAAHSGGKATCKAKAKCADCGAEYGDTNPNHHGDKLKHVVAKDATTSEEGNIEYWYCEACEKYFSDADAKNEITQAQTVIPKRQSSGSSYSYYTIKATAGAGGSISPSGNVSVREGSDQTFTITPDKGYAVSTVKIDGKSIGAVKSYTFENVSRTHTIEVIFVKGTASANTGDSSNLPLWSALLLASTITLAGAVHYKRKRAR